MAKTAKIIQLLDGLYEDPDGLGKQRVATRSLVIAPSLAGMERDLVKGLDLGRHVSIVSDKTTHAVLGNRIQQALFGACHVQSIVLGEAPHPDDATVSEIRKATQKADALIGGTVRDRYG